MGKVDQPVWNGLYEENKKRYFMALMASLKKDIGILTKVQKSFGWFQGRQKRLFEVHGLHVEDTWSASVTWME